MIGLGLYIYGYFRNFSFILNASGLASALASASGQVLQNPELIWVLF